MYCEREIPLLFTESETNNGGRPNTNRYVQDEIYKLWVIRTGDAPDNCKSRLVDTVKGEKKHPVPRSHIDL